MIDPGGVGVENLAGTGCDPARETIVVCLTRMDLPAHEEEHYVEDCYSFRESREVGKCGENVGENFGNGVRRYSAGRIQQAGYGGVCWANEFWGGKTFKSGGLPLVKKIEEKTI